MTTVKEFMDLGVEFVDGDVCREIFNKHWWKSATSTFDGEVVTYFAWRTNTGEKPGFSGLIEFTYNGEGCEMQECRQRENINWSIVKKWRPSLNQPKQNTPSNEDNEKPVFTQEFAIRGSSTHLVWKPCVIKYSGSKYVVIVDSNGREYSRKKAKLMTREIDTRTPKQKAVDELSDDLLSAPPHLNSKGVAEILVKLGYRKY